MEGCRKELIIQQKAQCDRSGYFVDPLQQLAEEDPSAICRDQLNASTDNVEFAPPFREFNPPAVNCIAVVLVILRLLLLIDPKIRIIQQVGIAPPPPPMIARNSSSVPTKPPSTAY